MEISVKRIWFAPATSEWRGTITGIVSLDGAQTCFSLENSDLMIPAGTYPVKMQWSHRFERKTPHLEVPGRTFIEMHGGNVAEDSEGCILVADKRIDDYRIFEAKPATEAIEAALEAAEANGEKSYVIVT